MKNLAIERYLEVVKLNQGIYSTYPIRAPFQDAGGQIYNVKAYGAKGDGTTNDTVTVQLALTTAGNAGGGTVYLPPGTYLISPDTGLNVPSNVIFQGAGFSSIIKVPNSASVSGNVVKSQTTSGVTIMNMLIDGNKANQSAGTNYGLYFGGANNSTVFNVWAQNFTGNGIHIYNGIGVKVLASFATANTFHGLEIEQCTDNTVQGNRSWSNTLHGLLISPGEVAGTGAAGNLVTGNSFDHNGQYGVASNAANGDVSAFLGGQNIITGNSIRSNSQYGVNFFKQNNFVLTDNDISLNGFFGLYAFESAGNVITGNSFHNNSQASNGAYDEILLEGWNSDNTHPANNNIISGNYILIDGANKARWAINEGTSHDGPNTIVNNVIPNAGTSGKINSLVSTDVLSDPAGVHQVYGGQSIAGANAGIDNAFNIMRLYSNLANSDIQVVSTGGTTHFYNGGNDVADVSSSKFVVNTPYGFQFATTPTNGYVLTSDAAGNASWQSPLTDTRTISTQTISYAAQSSKDEVIFANGAITITLPTAVGNTARYTIKNISTSTVTIATTSAQTIDGSASATLTTQNTSVDLISDNANWRIV